MPSRRVLLYFAWDRAGEIGAPLTVIDDRFPAIFELRRLFYPRFESLAEADQGIGGFLDHIQKPNFTAFEELAQTGGGHHVVQVERVAAEGKVAPLDEALIADADTIVVISFDSLRTGQAAGAAEIAAVRWFLDQPDHMIFVCPHHDIGETSGLSAAARQARELAEHLHHGDSASPPRQGFGGFARTLLAGLGVPVENRFGLRPAMSADGSPSPIDADRSLDDLQLLAGVPTFNLHPHLPQLERLGESATRMGVLARQSIDLAAPPHPFCQDGRTSFDALLQSNRDVFAGRLLVCDATLFSSTASGEASLRRFWANILGRARPS